MAENNRKPFDSFNHEQISWDNENAIQSDIAQLDEVEQIRIEVDTGLDEAFRELGRLQDEYGKSQGDTLIEQCKVTAIEAVTSQFGLASLFIDSKDGGNVTTVHNFKKGVVATKDDEKKYNKFIDNQNQEWQDVRKKGGYDAPLSDKRKKAFQSQEIIIDEYTGKQLPKNGRAQLDHIVSAKEIEDNPAHHLHMNSGQRQRMATSEDNLAFTDAGINQSKGKKPMKEFLNTIDKKTGKTKGEKLEIDTQKALEKDRQARQSIRKFNSKEAFKKYSSELLSTGVKDASKMVVYSAIGVVMREFVNGTFVAIKEVFATRAGKTFKEILTEFREKMKVVIAKITSQWKHILKHSFEGGITAFFSNLLVFVINLFVTTIKKIVVMIRAGFVSLVQAIKIMTNPPEGMDKEEARYQAVKILTAGLIGAGSLGLSAAIEKFLQAIPLLQPVMMFPIPGDGRTVSDIFAVTLSAILGSLLTTIVIYFMDKFRKDGENAKLQIQLVYQGNIVSYYKVAQTYLVLHDAYKFMHNTIGESKQLVAETTSSIDESFQDVSESSDELDELLEKLRNKSAENRRKR